VLGYSVGYPFIRNVRPYEHRLNFKTKGEGMSTDMMNASKEKFVSSKEAYKIEKTIWSVNVEEKDITQKHKLLLEIQRLASNCQLKRSALNDVNSFNTKKKKMLSFSAGVLSISSALLMTSVMTDLMLSNTIQLASVLLAASGGLTALYSSKQHSDREIANIYTGSAKFLFVREKTSYLTLIIDQDINKTMVSYNELVKEYIEISEIYDKYIPFESNLTTTS